MKSQVEATKVKAIAAVGEVVAKLNEHSDILGVLHKEAPALIASANMAHWFQEFPGLARNFRDSNPGNSGKFRESFWLDFRCFFDDFS